MYIYRWVSINGLKTIQLGWENKENKWIYKSQSSKTKSGLSIQMISLNINMAKCATIMLVLQQIVQGQNDKNLSQDNVCQKEK